MNSNGIRGGLSPYEVFTMVYHKDTGSLIESIKERKLQPMDAAVLLFLTTKVNVSTSRISVGASYIAESLDISLSRIHQSLKRLREHWVLGKGLKDGVPYYMLNPQCFHAGHTNFQPKRMAEFRKLFDYSQGEEVDKSLTPL